jgi:enoyl-CoA hydratase/carnithine racemase
MLGLRKAKELLMTSKLISGTEAERIGLVNMAVTDDKLEEEVWKVATNMAEVPLDGMAILKEALNTHAEILNRTALFTYHRQLNALGRIGRRGDGGLNLDALRQRTGEQQI